jgi:hypothetical protein
MTSSNLYAQIDKAAANSKYSELLDLDTKYKKTFSKDIFKQLLIELCKKSGILVKE